jgi:hypothetical protein
MPFSTELVDDGRRFLLAGSGVMPTEEACDAAATDLTSLGPGT